MDETIAALNRLIDMEREEIGKLERGERLWELRGEDVTDDMLAKAKARVARYEEAIALVARQTNP